VADAAKPGARKANGTQFQTAGCRDVRSEKLLLRMVIRPGARSAESTARASLDANAAAFSSGLAEIRAGQNYA